MNMSLVVCSRNRSRKLESFLQSLHQDEFSSVDGELVLVDSASDDGTFVVMKQFQSHATIPVTVTHTEVVGSGHARNVGMRSSRGDIIVFTDDDCFLSDGFLKQVMNVMERGFDYCGGRVLPWGSHLTIGCNFHSTYEIFPVGRVISAGSFISANLALRKHVADEVSFENWFGAGAEFRCEDIDYVTRASLRGFTGVFDPSLVVYHDNTSQDEEDAKRIRQSNSYGRGAYHMKFILQRHLSLLWWLSTLRQRPYPFSELYGGVRYLQRRMSSWISGE